MESNRGGGKQCIRPPALDDLDLVAAADGEAGPHVVAHLAVCDHCAMRASEIAGLQNALRRRLFRSFCPSSDDLLAFHYRDLSQTRRVTLLSHLDECPHCTRELEMLRRADIEPPDPDPEPRVLRLVARLLAPAAAVSMASLYGAARSGPGSVQYAYRAENLELTLRVARAVGRPGMVAVSGHIITDDGALESLLDGATASLCSGASLPVVAPLDELGGFFFEGVPSGEYQLSVQLGECEVVVEALAV